MIEILYIGGSLLCGGCLTLLWNRKNKTNDFIIKSDNSSFFKDTLSKAPISFKIQKNDTIQNPQYIDFINIDTIIVQGSASIKIINDIIYTNNNTFNIKKNTITFNTTSNHTDPLKIININTIKHIITKGSGSFDVRDNSFGTLDIELKGSGDIKMSNIHMINSTLKLKGSGSIKLDSYCNSRFSTVKINGSGDIYNKSQHMNIARVVLNGSGKLH